MSIKNPNDTIGNRTRDLPDCSAVPTMSTCRKRMLTVHSDRGTRYIVRRIPNLQLAYVYRAIGGSVVVGLAGKMWSREHGVNVAEWANGLHRRVTKSYQNFG